VLVYVGEQCNACTTERYKTAEISSDRPGIEDDVLSDTDKLQYGSNSRVTPALLAQSSYAFDC